MKTATPAFGLTLLIAAVTVGMMSEPERTGSIVGEGNKDGSAGLTHLSPQSMAERGKGKRAPHEIVPQGELERLALARLNLLTDRLGLDEQQRRETYPLVVRSQPGYDPGQPVHSPYQPSLAYLGPRLTTPDFDNAFFGFLDEDQQLDYASEVAEREAWWESVIERLENDLRRQTEPAEDLPEVPTDVPEHAPHRRGNLYDLIEN